MKHYAIVKIPVDVCIWMSNKKLTVVSSGRNFDVGKCLLSTPDGLLLVTLFPHRSLTVLTKSKILSKKLQKRFEQYVKWVRSEFDDNKKPKW